VSRWFCASLLFIFTVGGALPITLAIARSTQQPQDPKPSPPEGQPPITPQQPTAIPTAPVAPVTTNKPPARPKKIITNDDLKGSGPTSGFSPADFSLINNCNRACFDQVRQQAHVLPAANPNWKHELLQDVEQVRKDDDWQKYLRDLYEIHVKFCNLGMEKREDLARYTDPNNVTPKELAIDEKYDAKFAAAQNELRALDSRQAALQRKYAGSPLAYQFTLIQASRIQTATCYSGNYSPNDSDDP
jgi:hypothetical protein